MAASGDEGEATKRCERCDMRFSGAGSTCDACRKRKQRRTPAATAETQARGSANLTVPKGTLVVAIGIAAALVVAIAAFKYTAYKEQNGREAKINAGAALADAPRQEVNRALRSAPEPPPENPLARVVAASSLAEAIELARPRMSDTFDGTVELGAWAVRSMKWSDVVAKDYETTFGLAQKDPDEARGKRLCASGTIFRIESEKTPAGAFSGLLMTNAGSVFHFLAVGSSGTLVASRGARLCGVVTGWDGNAVAIVGMFDLPENRKR